MKNNISTMNNKICMVTGATSSIGEVTALELARQGATVIVIGRNPEKSTATVNKIKQITGNSKVDFMLVDLSSQKEIHNLVQQFQSRYQRLDVLINNAGALFLKRKESVDGIEMTLATNYLAPFLLTNLLIDILNASAPSRIINVSALLHKRAEIDFNDLQNKKRYNALRVYPQTKLENILFTYELARQLEGTGVTVNVLHPGVIASNLGVNNSRFFALARRFMNLFLTSPEKGAQTMIYLASSSEVASVTGKYFINNKSVLSSKASYDKNAALLLWQMSMALIGLSSIK